MPDAASAPGAAEPPESLITLRDVGKDYATGGGVVHALRDVQIDILRGEFVAIVGTSGSGKSTLMNILGCLDRPTHGSYRLAELEVGARGNDARAIVRNRLIGFIFQGFNLLPRTTALENVELPLQYRGVGVRERRRRAEEALRAVGLGDRMDHKPNQLSGGQQQRVAIARALVTDPPLLLADEPTGNLDTRTSLEVLALLQRLNRERGITVALVTHEHDIASCASRVIQFRDGRIVSDERQAAPMDAQKALSELPRADTGDSQDEGAGPARSARVGRGGPVPAVVYAGMVLGAVVGLVLALMYNAWVVGAHVRWTPGVFALVFESMVAARFARGKLGRPLTRDQRSRVAVTYTVAHALLFFVIFWFAIPKLPAPVLHQLDQRPAILLAAAVLGFGTLALLRFLLLSLFSRPRAARRKERPA